MKIIGITGGIGSGKTTITKYIESLGYPIYIADDEAKKLLDTEEVINEIRKNFGEEVIENNLVDKKKLSTFVFGNKDKLKQLNEIIHPKVRQHFINWVKQINSEIVFKEAAILFESGAYKDCDFTILVTAPEDVRVERVIKRDNSNKEDVIKRIRSQWSDEDKVKLSDFVINNIDLEESKKKINKILKKIVKISKGR
jgi:dephospho-CoA kinase